MNISDLNQSISDMSETDLHERIKNLRGERRKSDKPIRKKKAKAKAKATKAKPIKNLKTMASIMTREEKLAMIEALENM